MPLPETQQTCHLSPNFDFDSIMIYSSEIGQGREPLSEGEVPRYPLLRHKKDSKHGEPTDPENLIHTGGSLDAELAGPSEMDVERLKALYPKVPQPNDSKSGTAASAMRSRRAIMRGCTAARVSELDRKNEHDQSQPSPQNVQGSGNAKQTGKKHTKVF